MKGKKTAISADLPNYFTASLYSVFNPQQKNTSSSKRLGTTQKNDVCIESPDEFHLPSSRIRAPESCISMTKIPSRRGSSIPFQTFYDQTYMHSSIDLHSVKPSVSIDMSSIKKSPPKTKIDFYKRFQNHMNSQGFGKYKGIYSYRADQPHFLRVDSNSESALRSTMYNGFQKKKPIQYVIKNNEDFKVDEGLISLNNKIKMHIEKQESHFIKNYKKATRHQRSRSMESLLFATSQSPIRAKAGN
ncbi:unnamed protein product [Blepharisma stoltei]|uniref:Uncharacterized protein n=1 Tax=Blepharisma stoltei TaxID=1481888 RepID=A0AAU9JL36_9CILI|nr:unnamed protein product [Blepharisma stoltei]